MGQTFADLGVGGRKFLDAGLLLPCNSAGRPNLQRGDLVCDPVHQADAGGFPPQGGEADLGEAAMVSGVRGLVIPPYVGGYTGGRLVGCGDLHLQAPEYVCAIYCDVTYFVHFPEGRAEYCIMGP